MSSSWLGSVGAYHQGKIDKQDSVLVFIARGKLLNHEVDLKLCSTRLCRVGQDSERCMGNQTPPALLSATILAPEKLCPPF